MIATVARAIVVVIAIGVASTASAQRPNVVIITPPFFQPDAGPQIGGPPYRGPGFTIYPPNGTSLPPQLTPPIFTPFTQRAQTCVATPITCPADASIPQGGPCACPMNDGQAVQGTVQ